MRLFKKMLTGTLAALMVFSSAMTASVYAEDTRVGVVRLGGSDRFETANLIAEEGWKSADTVFLANSNSYADALAGTPLAYAYSAPILLTDGKKLSDSVKAEIRKLGAKNVYLLGGSAAISDAVANDLNKTYTVTRIWGQTRYDTALEIAKALEAKGQAPADIFIASGVNYPDALSASSAAAIKHAPILYAPANGKLDKNTLDYISRSKPYNTYILGGASAIASAAETALKGTSGSVTRLGGSDRYETSAVIAGQFDPQFKSDHAAFATGRNFPDALAGSVLAAKESMPVLLTDPAKTNGSVKKYFASRNRDKVFVFGGTAVVPDSVVSEYIGSVVPDADLDKYVGSYSCDRCSIEVKKTGGKNELSFDVWWSSSAFEHEEWSMSGVFDQASGKAAYSNAKRTNHVFYDSTGKDNVKTVYTNGTGSFTFNNDGSLTWDNTDSDASAKGMKFVKSSALPDIDTSKYAGTYTNDKCTVEVKNTENKNELSFVVSWNTRELTHEEWIMSGVMTDDSGKVSYYNAERSNHVLLDAIGQDNVTPVYNNGKGSFAFGSDGSLVWNNDWNGLDKDLPAKEMKLVKPSPLPDVDLSKYVGRYGYSRCTIDVSESGEKNGLKFDIQWSNSAADYYSWTMTGIVDPATYSRVNFSDSVKTYHKFDSTGKEIETKVVYKDGVGRFQFGDGYLLWQDEQESKENEELAQTKFVRSGAAPEDDVVDLSKYVGRYGYSRCTIDVSESGEKNGLKFDIQWSNSAADYYSWTMTGIVDPATYSRVNFSDSVKTYHKFDGTGKEIETKVVYKDGVGRFQFGDGYLLWQDEQESKENEELAQTKFVRSGNVPADTSKEDAVKSAVEEMYKINYGKVVEEVKFNDVKVYTAEEIAADPILKNYKLSEKDIVFDVSYDLKIIEGYENIMAFTAGSGVIDGQWVRQKYNCGTLKYSDGEYTVDNFGTAF